MNPTYIGPALKAAQSAWAKFAEYREDKQREAYDALATAAETASSSLDDNFPRARKEAGNVTKAAHARLERTLAELADRPEEVAEELGDRVAEAKKAGRAQVKEARKEAKAATKQARKESKRTQKQLFKKNKQVSKKIDKARAKALKKAQARAAKKEKGSKFWPIAAVLAVISAIAGGVYYWLRKNDTPATEPPRVEEFGADKVQGSTLVYTSTSAADDLADTPADKAAVHSDLAEEGVVERDEKLLGDIDEQIAKLRQDGSTTTADRIEAEAERKGVDENFDDAKHRLDEDNK